MAAYMSRGFYTVTKLCTSYVSKSSSAVISNVTRFAHNKPVSVDDRDTWVVFTARGDSVVCWHPEPEFPYELSKPLLIMQPELREGDSALKIQHRLEDLNRYSKDGPTMEELMKMTFTTKHRWYPHNGKRKIKPNPPVDREGI